MTTKPSKPSGRSLSARVAALTAKVERLEGPMRQLLAERTSDTITRPTWADIQELRAEINVLKRRMENR